MRIGNLFTEAGFKAMTARVPIILLVFNRPGPTRQLLERLRTQRPERLLIVADGPRPNHPTDAKNCAAVRELIEREVDWPSDVSRLYADSNLGLRQRVFSGLDWAFGLVERAIVLEDDCIPHPSFFRFCGELLESLAADTRIGAIAGDNFQPQPFPCDASYYFSRYPHCWGWATWQRAWKSYDDDMRLWPGLRASGWLNDLFPNRLEAEYWREIFDRVHARRTNSWAYAWTFACWSQNLLTALPGVNLVTNIGVGVSATHTQDTESQMHLLPTSEIAFPLRHPTTRVRDHHADAFSQQHVFGRAKDRSLRGRLERLWRSFQRRVKPPGR